MGDMATDCETKTSKMGFFSHSIEKSDAQRGDHIYALRVFGSYQHHGIVITATDAVRFGVKPVGDEELMVVEQNKNGLQIVTMENFVFEKNRFYKHSHTLRRVQYDENPFVYGIKRRGSCYTAHRLPSDLVVENALLIYTDEAETNKWSAYSLRTRNCEHFAFVCSTKIGRLSEQVLAKYDLLVNSLNRTATTAVPLLNAYLKGFLRNVISIGEKMIPSSISNVTITSIDEFMKASWPANALTSLIALAVEVAFLTVRWVVYLWTRDNEQRLANRLADGTAINTDTYVRCLIEASLGNLGSFVMSLVGGFIGSLIPLPFCAIGFSIFFGFVGYTIGRLSADKVIVAVKKLTE